jgi:hypothetical protein
MFMESAMREVESVDDVIKHVAARLGEMYAMLPNFSLDILY